MDTPEIKKHMRMVRSFIRREGRVTTGQEQALEKFSKDYLLDPTHALDFQTIFHNTHPVILEIGFGMGHSLLAQAMREPHHNFIGIEVHRAGVGALLSGITQNRLPNVRIIADDAVTSLSAFADHSLTGIQIFFPDPWHKKRHHKRRLIQTSFVKRLAEKLQPHGYLHCATDWQPYAEWILDAVNASQMFMNQSPTQTYVERPVTRPVTKFEKRGIALGHQIFDLMFVRG